MSNNDSRKGHNFPAVGQGQHKMKSCVGKFRKRYSLSQGGSWTGNGIEWSTNKRGKILNLNIKGTSSANRLQTSDHQRINLSNTKMRNQPKRSNSFGKFGYSRERSSSDYNNEMQKPHLKELMKTETPKSHSTKKSNHGSCSSTPLTRKTAVRACKLSFFEENNKENKYFSDLEPSCSNSKYMEDYNLFYGQNSAQIGTNHSTESNDAWKSHLENQVKGSYNSNDIILNDQVLDEQEYITDESYSTDNTNCSDEVEFNIQEENVFTGDDIYKDLSNDCLDEDMACKQCDAVAEHNAECCSSYQENAFMASMDLSDVSESSFVSSNEKLTQKSDDEQSIGDGRNDESINPQLMGDITEQLHYYKDKHDGMLEVIFDLKKNADRKERIIRDLRRLYAGAVRRDKDRRNYEKRNRSVSENDVHNLERICRAKEKQLGEIKSKLNRSDLKLEELTDKYSDLKHEYRSLKYENERLKVQLKDTRHRRKRIR